MTPLEFRLVNDFQRGFPLERRPFARIARDCRADARDVIAAFRSLRARGAIGRIGAVFRPNTVGASMLAAIEAPEHDLDRVAALVSRRESVNHNYARDHAVNLWFVVTAPDAAMLEREVVGIEADTGLAVMRFPLVEPYHIDLGFDLASQLSQRPSGHRRAASNGAPAPAAPGGSMSGYPMPGRPMSGHSMPGHLMPGHSMPGAPAPVATGYAVRGRPMLGAPVPGEPADQAVPSAGHSAEQAPASPAAAPMLDEADRRLVHAIEHGLPLAPRPYDRLAARAGLTVAEVQARVARWQDDGVVHRFGVIVRHAALGYVANAMAVWDVPDEQARRIGCALAAEPRVTLCYRRARSLPRWPYNLYCMIHGHDRAEVGDTLARLIRAHGLGHLPHTVLFRRHEYKQTGARYRREPEQADAAR